MSNLTVTISPEVIRTVVRNTALATPGVLALVESERVVGRAMRGVDVKMADGRAIVALRVVASTDVSLHALSQQLRQSVAEVVEEVTGIPVTLVDVSIEDVRK